MTKQLSSEHLPKNRIKQNIGVLWMYSFPIKVDYFLILICFGKGNQQGISKDRFVACRFLTEGFLGSHRSMSLFLLKTWEVRFFFSKVFCTDLSLMGSWWEKHAKWSCSLCKLRSSSVALWGGVFCLFAFRKQIIFWDQLVLRNSLGNRFFFP